MSECRALTNLVGNGVACIVISRSENELDVDKLHETMAHPIAIGEEMETSPGVGAFSARQTKLSSPGLTGRFCSNHSRGAKSR